MATRAGGRIIRVFFGLQHVEHIFKSDALHQGLNEIPVFTDPSSHKKFEVLFVAIMNKANEYQVSALIPPIGCYYASTTKAERSKLFKHIAWANVQVLRDKKIEGLLTFQEAAAAAESQGGLTTLFNSQFVTGSSSAVSILAIYKIYINIIFFYCFHLIL